jgi:hypothetical protein
MGGDVVHRESSRDPGAEIEIVCHTTVGLRQQSREVGFEIGERPTVPVLGVVVVLVDNLPGLALQSQGED